MGEGKKCQQECVGVAHVQVEHFKYCVARCKECVPEDGCALFLETHEQLFSEREKKKKKKYHAVCCQNEVGDQLRGLALI